MDILTKITLEIYTSAPHFLAILCKSCRVEMEITVCEIEEALVTRLFWARAHHLVNGEEIVHSAKDQFKPR